VLYVGIGFFCQLTRDFELWSDQDYSGLSSYHWSLSTYPHCFLVVRWSFVWIDWSIPCIDECNSLFSLHVLDYSLLLYAEDTILFWYCPGFVWEPFVPWIFRYPLAVFRMFMNIMLKHEDDLLHAGSSCSFIRWCDLICLTFHERNIFVLLLCPGSCFFSYHFPREPLSLQFVPALVGRGANSITMFLSLALCWEYWAVASCPSKGACSSTFLDAYWKSLYYSFFYSLYYTLQTRIFRKALYLCAHARLRECSPTRTRACVNGGDARALGSAWSLCLIG